MIIKESMQNQYLQNLSLLGSISWFFFSSHLKLLQKTNSMKINITKTWVYFQPLRGIFDKIKIWNYHKDWSELEKKTELLRLKLLKRS